MIYITGDTHGDFKRIEHFCNLMGTTKKDVMIILGDAGINYSGDENDLGRKNYISRIPITLFCIHGNHERRPSTIHTYVMSEWNGGKVWLEYDYPTIMFAKDGEIYDIAGQKTIVMGGAYSVDKWYRLEMGYRWFPDEQPSEEIKKDVEKTLDGSNWNVDIVLSHTTPLKYEPVDMFLPGLDQSTVDDSTERWLDEIEEKLNYKWWYAGHFHTDRTTDRLQLMFKDIELFKDFYEEQDHGKQAEIS